jgi:F-type H+-transporting ATPase subunit c
MKKVKVLFLAAFALMVAAPSAFAAMGGSDVHITAISMIALGCVVGLGIAAGGGGIGMGHAISGALTAMARNPGFYQRLFPNMLIGLALIESLVIYTLVIVLILLYANPL